jgi:type IV pilus assembly protein PilC
MAETAISATPFLWEGTDRRGKKVKGKSLAANEAAVRADLRRQGVVPSRIRKQSKSLFSGRSKITPGDIAIFSRQLATMLSAGIPLVQAFEIVGNGHENEAMQKLILGIKADVEGGSALAEALAKQPLYFDDLFVNLVEAGEQAGALETLLDKIATYKEKTEAIKKKIKKALTYPAAVLVVAFMVTTILLIFVIPAFEDLFSGFGADLPAFTQIGHRSFGVRSRAGLDTGNADLRGVCRRILLFQETIARDAALSRPHDSQGPGDRPDHPEIRHRPLRAHVVHHVQRRRAAG